MKFITNRWSWALPGRTAWNSAINIAGQGLPLIVAIVTFPLLIRGLGEARFGALSIAWLLTGYASIFDFGLGRAVTQLTARARTSEARDAPANIAFTALAIMLASGTLATFLMFYSATFIASTLLNIEGELARETARSLQIIAFALPVVILTTGVRGILEAYNRFTAINLIRIPVGAMNYIAPLLVLPFTTDLTAVVAAVIAVRVVETLAYLALSLATLPQVSRARFDRRHARAMLNFGSWMTISNIIAPIMISFDRFFIARFASLAAVTYYVTPYSVVTKLRIIPSGMMGVMFPRFSEELARDRASARRLYHRSLVALALLLAPPVLLVVAFAKPGLGLWIDPEFAERSFRSAQILAIGTFFHGLAQAPFTIIQASGRPDITAKVHMLEIPLYIAYLYLFTVSFGITGAATAWTLRVFISLVLLTLISDRIVRREHAPRTSGTEKIHG